MKKPFKLETISIGLSALANGRFKDAEKRLEQTTDDSYASRNDLLDEIQAAKSAMALAEVGRCCGAVEALRNSGFSGLEAKLAEIPGMVTASDRGRAFLPSELVASELEATFAEEKRQSDVRQKKWEALPEEDKDHYLDFDEGEELTRYDIHYGPVANRHLVGVDGERKYSIQREPDKASGSEQFILRAHIDSIEERVEGGSVNEYHHVKVLSENTFKTVRDAVGSAYRECGYKVFEFIKSEPQYPRLDQEFIFLGNVPERPEYGAVGAKPTDLYYNVEHPWGKDNTGVPVLVEFRGEYAPSGKPAVVTTMGPEADGMFLVDADDRLFRTGAVMAEAAGFDTSLSSLGPVDFTLERKRENLLDLIAEPDTATGLYIKSVIMAAKTPDDLDAMAAAHRHCMTEPLAIAKDYLQGVGCPATSVNDCPQLTPLSRQEMAAMAGIHSKQTAKANEHEHDQI